MNYIYDNKSNKNKLLERFVRYVQIWTESDEEAADKGVFPSTDRQFDLAKVLEGELKELGLQNVQVTKDCYVYGFLPGNLQTISNSPRNDAADNQNQSILLLAHMDTTQEVSGKNVKPQIKPVKTQDTQDDSQASSEDDIIITSDGTTLLGGDDKAGVAAIMSALAFLVQNPQIKHRPVEVMFSPDEETGHGMDKVPLNLIKSKAAYTVDGGNLGEMETECFNAWAASITFTGKATHTGYAKEGGMVNASVMASAFVAGLPRHKAPETTSNYEGFIAPMRINGSIESAQVDLLLRAFTTEEIEEEKVIVKKLAHAVEASFGGKAKASFKQQYLNMHDKMEQNPQVVEQLEKAYEAAGVQIIKKPIRGGTDGSRLTEMGIPTPNIFTGAHEIHSRKEWVSLNQMSKAADVLINLLSQIE